jgi:hypothetical protein
MLSLFRELLTGLRVLPIVLKVDSEATVEIGTTKMPRVNRAKIGYLGAFSFHHERMSNCASTLASSRGADRYSSIFDFVGSTVFIPLKKFFKPALVSLIVLDELELINMLKQKQLVQT